MEKKNTILDIMEVKELKKLDKFTLKNVKSYCEKFEKCDECSDNIKYNNLKKCYFCGRTKLCEKHYNRGLEYGRIYRLMKECMCDSCCWWEIG